MFLKKIELYFNNLDLFLKKYSKSIKIFNNLISIGCLFIVYQHYTENEVSFNWDLKNINIILLFLISYIFFASSWSNLLNRKISKTYILIWLMSTVGKYLPLKLGVPLMRISEVTASKDQTKSKDLITSTLFEQIVLIITGVIFGLLFFINDENIQLLFLSLILSLSFIYFIFSSKRGKEKNKILISFCISSFGYLFLILGIALLSSFLFGEFNLNFAYSYILTSSLSLLFIGPPAGIGIREVLFYNLLSTNAYMNSSEIVEFMLIIRLLLIFTDLLSYLISKFIFNLNS